MNDHFHFDIQVLQDEHVTIAAFTQPGLDHIIGSAKRHPTDPHNPTVGMCLALSRSFKVVSDHYRALADMLMMPEEELIVVNVADLAEADWLEQFNIPAEELGTTEGNG